LHRRDGARETVLSRSSLIRGACSTVPRDPY
jgi:hypothetical protein